MGNRAVILAGGKASRLGSYTTVLPKPLLPVGDRPVLDILLGQLRSAGFDRVTLAVGYLAHLVRAVVANGGHHGMHVDYHYEERPMGTIGPLSEIDDLHDSFLLLNGDVLTTLDYGDLLEAHRASGNIMTVACHQRVVRTEYGVIHVNGANGNGTGRPNMRRVVGFEEKPELSYTVSMGVYAMEPRITDYIPDAQGQFDFPALVYRLAEAGERVGSYRFDGTWFDLGRNEDYERATDEFALLSAELDPEAPSVSQSLPADILG